MTVAHAVPSPAPVLSPNAAKEYHLQAEGIRATFIPLGACMTSLQVPDRAGQWREVNLGFSEASQYTTQKSPSYFGAVIGRVANRLGGGKFAIDGKQYQVSTNENNNTNMLHGGFVGYDAREWTVVASSASSITFQLLDQAFEGFPGNVLAIASFTLNNGKLTTVLNGFALDEPTPILLTTHCFFNLNSNGESTAEDILHVPSASRYVEVDGGAIPTGKLVDMKGTDNALNYLEPHAVKDTFASRACAADGEGVDNCFIFDEPAVGNNLPAEAQVILTGSQTGIRLSVRTNQPAIQLYGGLAFDGSVLSNVGPVQKYGCMAIEPQGYIDGINHPEWKQNQVYTPATGPLVNIAEYAFDIVA